MPIKPRTEETGGGRRRQEDQKSQETLCYTQFQADLGSRRHSLNRAKQTRSRKGLAILAGNCGLPSPPRQCTPKPHAQGVQVLSATLRWLTRLCAEWSSSHGSIYRNRRKGPQQIPSAYREVGGEQVGRAGEGDPGVVVLPDAAAAALHPGLPHALCSRLQAGQ